MQPSKVKGVILLFTFRLQMAGSVFLLSFWMSVCVGGEIASPKVNQCAAVGKISAASLTVLAEMQAGIEKSLFYSIPAASVGIKECSIRDDSGVLQLEYRFKNSGWLRVVGDERIEYSMQEIRYIFPSTDEAMATLKHGLKDWFGGVDCGIDWSKPKVVVANDDASAMETVYWGEVCNCSARIRRDSGNRVIGLRISSVCN